MYAMSVILTLALLHKLITILLPLFTHFGAAVGGKATIEMLALVIPYSENTIGLYRENAIAIESEARDPFGGNVYYVTMQITFPIPEIHHFTVPKCACSREVTG